MKKSDLIAIYRMLSPPRHAATARLSRKPKIRGKRRVRTSSQADDVFIKSQRAVVSGGIVVTPPRPGGPPPQKSSRVAKHATAPKTAKTKPQHSPKSKPNISIAKSKLTTKKHKDVSLKPKLKPPSKAKTSLGLKTVAKKPKGSLSVKTKAKSSPKRASEPATVTPTGLITNNEVPADPCGSVLGSYSRIKTLRNFKEVAGSYLPKAKKALSERTPDRYLRLLRTATANSSVANFVVISQFWVSVEQFSSPTTDLRRTPAQDLVEFASCVVLHGFGTEFFGVLLYRFAPFSLGFLRYNEETQGRSGISGTEDAVQDKFLKRSISLPAFLGLWVTSTQSVPLLRFLWTYLAALATFELSDLSILVLRDLGNSVTQLLKYSRGILLDYYGDSFMAVLEALFNRKDFFFGEKVSPASEQFASIVSGQGLQEED